MQGQAAPRLCPGVRPSEIGRPHVAPSRAAHLSTRLRAIIGIDLGTTNSALAHVGPDGPQVLCDTAGNATIPSLVAITDDDRTLFGWAAMQMALSNDTSTATTIFSSFKRLLGRRFCEVPPALAATLPYPLLEGDRSETVMYCAGADGLVTPEELSAWLLKHLMTTAAAALGESITGAVVTVPAHFNRSQRGATLDAATAAGLAPVHLLQEPVAAALAYGIDGGTDGETVLVFDVGGGTFDVSVLQAFEGIMQVLGTDGDAALGGDDFDAALAAWILSELGLSIEDQGDDVKVWAMQAARDAKEALSERDSVAVEVPAAVGGGGQVEVTEAALEAAAEGLFSRMAGVLERIGRETFVEWAVSPAAAVPAAAAAAAAAADKAPPAAADKWAPPPRRISKIALVGQLTRLPSVRRFVATAAGVEPCTSVDPGAAVALGAATHAGVLLGIVGSVELMDGSFVVDLHARTTGFADWSP